MSQALVRPVLSLLIISFQSSLHQVQFKDIEYPPSNSLSVRGF
jgi:hypothetical protein